MPQRRFWFVVELKKEKCITYDGKRLKTFVNEEEDHIFKTVCNNCGIEGWVMADMLSSYAISLQSGSTLEFALNLMYSCSKCDHPNSLSLKYV